MKRKIIILLFAGITLLINSSFAQQKDAQEYTLKAAFIYRFTDYIEWQDNSSDIFTIAVLGESGIVTQLNELAKNKKIKNKRIQVVTR